jgi:hypothetical protein
LRNGSDSERKEIRPVSLSELMGGKPPAPAAGAVRRVSAPQPPKPPDFYVVEVIQGDKHSQEKFPMAPPAE